jgi:hypothetical protein
MEPPESTATTYSLAAAVAAGPGRVLWHALALMLAAAIGWLIFTAYRQPDLLLDLAGMRLC